jgi:putative FmdB family regulatory protein
MPTYAFTCGKCGEEFDYLQRESPNVVKPPSVRQCPKCGADAERSWSFRPYGHVNSFQEYTDVHATGKPVRIKSRREQLKFWKQHNVRNPGDPFY